MYMLYNMMISANAEGGLLNEPVAGIVIHACGIV